MEYQNFKLEIDEQGIAVFTANRPEKMNALNDLSWAEMNQFFTWADKADDKGNYRLERRREGIYSRCRS